MVYNKESQDDRLGANLSNRRHKTHKGIAGCAAASICVWLSVCIGMTQPALAGGPVMRPSPTPSTSQPSGVPSPQATINPPSSSAPFEKPDSTPYQPTSSTPGTTSPQTEMPSAGTTTQPSQSTVPPQQTQPGPAQPGTVSGTIQYNAQPAGGPSAHPGDITILQALNEALISGPRAAAIRAQLPVAKAGIAAATVSPNPILFFDRAQYSEGVRRIGPNLTIDWPWKLAFRMMAAIKTYDQAKLDLLTTMWQLRADTRRAYTELVIANESQRTLTDLYNLTARLLQVSKKRFQAGDVPELDVLRAQLATSQAEVDLSVGRQRIVRARQQLNIMLGRKVEGSIEVPHLPEFIEQQKPIDVRTIRHGILPDFSLSVANLQHYTEIASANRYEILSLKMQKTVNKWNLKNAYGAAVPDLGVAFGSSEENNLPSGPNLTAQFVTINAEIPISNTNQGDIAKFTSAGRQLTYQMASQQNQVLADVSSAYNNLLAARERIRVYQEHVLRDSNEVARLSRRSYEVGQSDINSTLLAQQANVQIRQAYLDAVTNYQGAYTDLEQACGRPLE